MSALPFLTAYDPTDLPAGSIDPLGFERGYLHLAEKLLPGLTNVADRPRYFAVLCAGAHLASDAGGPPRAQYKRRLDVVLRFERYWVLANALAESEDLPGQGLRGVTRARERAAEAQNHSRVGADFRILSRQIPYGAVGIYGTVAERLGFLLRDTLGLTPDAGDRLGAGFLAATEPPPELRRAALDKATSVRVDALREWGTRAHVSGPANRDESLIYRDGLRRDGVRERMIALLVRHAAHDGEHEQVRLSRIAQAIHGDAHNADLFETVRAVLAWERCYRLALLAFERVLWLCREAPAGGLGAEEVTGDAIVREVSAELPCAVEDLCRALDGATTDRFRRDLDRLIDVRRFLERARGRPLIEAVLERHAEVQAGKFDRGATKAPWLERRGDRLALAFTRAGTLSDEPRTVDQIAAHPYRTYAADQLAAAAGMM